MDRDDQTEARRKVPKKGQESQLRRTIGDDDIIIGFDRRKGLSEPA